MASSTIAVYPGTFDPMTLGHQDIIRRASVLFGTVIVAVAQAHHKKTLFTFFLTHYFLIFYNFSGKISYFLS